MVSPPVMSMNIIIIIIIIRNLYSAIMPLGGYGGAVVFNRVSVSASQGFCRWPVNYQNNGKLMLTGNTVK